MKRFVTQKQPSPVKSLFLSLGIFLLILVLFLWGFSSISRRSVREEENTLRQALVESAVHCYALHGYYPESLEDLVRDYGITYDSSYFLVDYQPQGENLMPEITVIRKGDKN